MAYILNIFIKYIGYLRKRANRFVEHFSIMVMKTTCVHRKSVYFVRYRLACGYKHGLNWWDFFLSLIKSHILSLALIFSFKLLCRSIC